MKVSFLYQRGKTYEQKQKVVGIYAWENKTWVLYAPLRIKNMINPKLKSVDTSYCKNTKGGFLNIRKTFTSEDYDFIANVNGVLVWEFRPSFSVGNIESLDKPSVERFKELLAFIEED